MKKLLTIFLSAILLILPLTACGGNDDGKIKIRLNEVTHSIFYAPQYLALSLGYFEEEGLEIELINGGGADVSMNAILSGAADIGFMGPEAAIYVYTQGRKDYPIIFGQLTKRDGSFLVARQPDENFDYSKLQGKEIIAGRKGGMPAMTLEYVLNQHGLYDGQNITLRFDIKFDLMAPAFESGTGDYVALFEPVASSLEQRGTGYIVASIGADSGEVPYTAYMAEQSYIQKNPEIIKKFLRAIYRAQQKIKDMTDEEVAEKILSHFSGSTLEQITAAVRNYRAIDAWMDNPIMTEESFNRMQDILENAGQLQSRADYTKLVNNSFAQAVINELQSS